MKIIREGWVAVFVHGDNQSARFLDDCWCRWGAQVPLATMKRVLTTRFNHFPGIIFSKGPESKEWEANCRRMKAKLYTLAQGVVYRSHPVRCTS